MMSDRQYRTLGEGDRRLPGYECRLRYVPHAQWVPSDAVGIIDADDIRRAEYRVPCSATVAPDGYEVVQRERLPKGTRGQGTWMIWSRQKAIWLELHAEHVPHFCCTYAAPAGELAALYAAGDAERKQPAPVGDGWRLLGDDELIAHGDETSEGGAPWKEIAAFEYHRAAGVFGAHNRYRRRVEPQPVEQPAPAPATPWVYVGDRPPPVNVRVVVSTAPRCDDPRPSVVLTWSGERWYRDGVWYSGAVHWLDLAAVDRLAAENAALVRERDEARAEVAEVRRAWDATVEARDEALAELERLQGCVDASRRRADRAEASLAATTKAYDAALAEVERLKEKSEALVRHFVAMLCQDCSAHAGDRCPSPTEIMDALKGRCHLCDAAEVERLRGEAARVQRDADHVGELRRRILAATAALEGRDV